MTHADTEGLLDRCHCGAIAGFEFDSPAPFRMVQVRARCTECCEQTDYCMEHFNAVFVWNLARRAEKEKKDK